MYKAVKCLAKAVVNIWSDELKKDVMIYIFCNTNFLAFTTDWQLAEKTISEKDFSPYR